MSDKKNNLRFKKAYVEITDVCNLNCSFCKGTTRKKEFMTPDNFSVVARKLRAYTEYIYLHVMGEPTLHPQLDKILDICEKLEYKVVITTNGTLLEKTGKLLLESSSLHKVNISVHALEANSGIDFDDYLNTCFDFAEKLSEKGKICVLRLWNLDGGLSQKVQNSLNEKILSVLNEKFPDTFTENTRGFRIRPRLFLEFDKRFEWRTADENTSVTCYGLRDQIGILCDGSVVPCCIDCDGAINLGNIFNDSVEDILNSERVMALVQGFREKKAVEEYCRHCGFVRRLETGKKKARKSFSAYI